MSHDSRTVRERMLAGEDHLMPDPELLGLQAACKARLEAFHAAPEGDMGARIGALKELFGRIDMPSHVQGPLFIDYGKHTEVGRRTFINANVTILDSARVRIGDEVAIGPNVQLITATHPIWRDERFIEYPEDEMVDFRAVTRALPITIEDGVWIGAGVIVLPGVTIGKGSVVGAGSVVTRDIPENVIAVGNPCRVLREIGESDRGR